VENVPAGSLGDVILALESKETVRRFLAAFFSPDEVTMLSIRWEIMKLSAQGLSRKEIQHRLGPEYGPPSLGTISRANLVVKHGDGIVQELLEQMQQSHSSAPQR